MSTDRFALPGVKTGGNSHIERTDPSGFSNTFGLPYWQLAQANNTPPEDRFVKQAIPTERVPDSGPGALGSNGPFTNAAQTMQGHVKAWLTQNPDLLAVVEDPSKTTPSGKTPHGKKRRRKTTPIVIGETDFSSRTSSGKEPGKCQVYSPYGNLSAGE